MIIKVSQITKIFNPGTNVFDCIRSLKPISKHIVALKDISFSVEKGERVAILGLNGAGKTTLLKLLACLFLPDQGQIMINGVNIQHKDSKRRLNLGFMSGGEKGFYDRLTVRGNLEFFAMLYNLSPFDAKKRIDYLCSFFQIEDKDKRFQECSTGIKQRCHLARSLLSDPEIILMDEPTRSIDPKSASRIKEYMKGLSDEGKTVIFSTHNIDEARDVADRMIYLENGKIKSVEENDSKRKQSRCFY